jgi:phage/plasmid primase-like uncharacterized protein
MAPFVAQDPSLIRTVLNGKKNTEGKMVRLVAQDLFLIRRTRRGEQESLRLMRMSGERRCGRGDRKTGCMC